MVAESQLISAREYAMWPEQRAPIELIGGEVVVSPGPTPDHEMILSDLKDVLRSVAEARQLGRWFQAPLDLFISGYDVLQPDLMLFAPDQLPGRKELPVEKIPLIVLEVLSPGTRRTDLREKLPKYASRGIGEYWVVDPTNKSVTINLLNDFGAYQPHIVGSLPINVGLYEGIRLPLADIFAE
ncbi:Uma2 family endonuclease [soil metagenome]